MNRSNVGNVVTNGMQILSVGATTASRVLGRADKTLNNLTPEEQARYNKMQADIKREKMNSYYNKTDNAFRRLDEQEQSDYRDYQANEMRKRMYGEEEDKQSVDKLMEKKETPAEIPLPETEQAKEIAIKSENSVSWLDSFRERTKGKSPADILKERHKKLKENTNNANV